MGRKKLARFKEIEVFENVIEPSKDIFEKIKGTWHEYFGNNNPIVIELGCGRGEYTNGLAENFPDKNFIGVDLKGERVWRGAVTSHEKGLKNTAFLRTQIQKIEDFFEENEVDEIWITFPDPRPEKERQRLTTNRFFEHYKKILKPGGLVRLKTDNTPFFDFTLEVLRGRKDIKNLEFTHDLYQSNLRAECHDIKTKYEEIFTAKGEDIKYLRFQFC